MAVVAYGLGRFGDRRLEKGGPVARGAGGAAGLVYPSSWQGPGGRDAVSPASSQPVGDGMPLLLGSWWGVVLAPLFVVLFAIRSGIEERALLAGLPGYADYTIRVRYRLVPGIW
jgi:hypothetical protein